MFKLIKYLKKSVVAIIAIIALLVVQAICDLSLPSYTSNIVNVGIQQGGIENAVPKVIRKSELEKLTLFMSEANKNKVMDSYKLLEKASLTNEEFNSYKEQYPKIEKESLYKLDTNNEDKIEELN